MLLRIKEKPVAESVAEAFSVAESCDWLPATSETQNQDQGLVRADKSNSTPFCPNTGHFLKGAFLPLRRYKAS
ncbi:MAG TPA: hypothetical protein VI685_26550 [Candidatus Angelobacter sp.]